MQTKGPDVIFTNKVGQEIVLEIETGKSLRLQGDRTDEKFKEVFKKYGVRAYLILTDLNKFFSFNNYGLKIIPRNQIPNFIQLQFSGINNLDIVQRLTFINYRIAKHKRLKTKKEPSSEPSSN